jgi:hypothetical protein
VTALNLTPEALTRFWSKVDIKDEDSCWLWTRAVNSKGYGSFAINGKGVSAHKISWALAKNDGVLSGPKDHVMHSCDVRSCVNPNHLSLGSARDNARDAISKGRNVVRIPSKDPYCKKGHPRTTENTHPKKHTCLVCERDSNRESKRRERERDRPAYNKKHREYYQKTNGK